MSNQTKEFSNNFIYNKLNWSGQAKDKGWWLQCKICNNMEISYIDKDTHAAFPYTYKEMVATHIADEDHKENLILYKLGGK